MVQRFSEFYTVPDSMNGERGLVLGNFQVRASSATSTSCLTSAHQAVLAGDAAAKARTALLEQ